jgi:hypothetical protein
VGTNAGCNIGWIGFETGKIGAVKGGFGALTGFTGAWTGVTGTVAGEGKAMSKIDTSAQFQNCNKSKMNFLR